MFGRVNNISSMMKAGANNYRYGPGRELIITGMARVETLEYPDVLLMRVHVQNSLHHEEMVFEGGRSEASGVGSRRTLHGAF